MHWEPVAHRGLEEGDGSGPSTHSGFSPGIGGGSQGAVKPSHGKKIAEAVFFLKREVIQVGLFTSNSKYMFTCIIKNGKLLPKREK